jgi:mycothiol synthase
VTHPVTALPVLPAGAGVRFRPWAGLGDVAGMAAATATLREHAGLVEPVDLELMRHRFTHLVNSDLAVDCILVERAGATVGYARVEWHDLADGTRVFDITTVIEPSAWGIGVADALVRWGEERSREIAAALSDERPSFFANYVFGHDEELEGALDRLGYEAVRWDAEMLRADLEDLPAVAVPDGYVLRAPEPDELEAVHAMLVAGFADHWGAYEAEEHLIEEWVEDPRFRRDLVVVAWAGGAPAAGISSVLERMPDGAVRAVFEGLSTHPDHRRRGLATACMARLLELVRAAGASSAQLGVDTDNPNRALPLYEACGFRVATLSTSYRKPFHPPEEPTT